MTQELGTEDPSKSSDRTDLAAVEARIAELVSRYGGDDGCMAEFVCDQWPADQLAYRVIGTDDVARTVTYGALRRESEGLARALAELGVGPGDRVATLMEKGREFLVSLVAIWRLGAVHVPLFTAFAPPAIVVRLRGSEAKVVISDERQLSKLDAADEAGDLPPCSIVSVTQAGSFQQDGVVLRIADGPSVQSVCCGPDTPIIHIYTSGTTGNPKGVVVPMRALASFHAYAEFALDLRQDDVYWCAADPGWAYGLYFGVVDSLLTGTSSVFLKGAFSADRTYQVLEACGVTNFTAAPTVYRSLREAGVPKGRRFQLRCASSAGEPLTPDVNEWAAGALGVPVYDHFGQTEAGMLINNHHLPILQRPLRPGSMGQPMPGWRAAILDDADDKPVAAGVRGRVAMDVPNSPLAWFSGYAGDPAATAIRFAGDGRWYLTGDAGWQDEEGNFFFAARDDDIIIMAGYRIGPLEVETVIEAHPWVVEAAVIAVPDQIRGEVMEAFVRLQPGETATPELASELQQWVKTRYAAHAFPRTVFFVDDLPKTPSGKLQRSVLRQRRREALAQSASPVTAA